MTAAGPPERRFTDEEVAELIRRAIDLQESSRGAGSSVVPSPGVGLTLSEVKQVAAEVGVDPRFVDLAATPGAVAEEEGTLAGFLGAPWTWRYSRIVPGAVPEEDRARIVSAVRRVLGQKGEIDDVYGHLEWSHDDGLGPVLVEVSSRDGETRVEVSGRRGGLAGLLYGLVPTFGGILGGGAVAGLLGVSPPLALVPVLGMAAACWLGTRIGWKRISKGWERRLRRVTDEVAEAAAALALPSPSGRPGAEGAAPEGPEA